MSDVDVAADMLEENGFIDLANALRDLNDIRTSVNLEALIGSGVDASEFLCEVARIFENIGLERTSIVIRDASIDFFYLE